MPNFPSSIFSPRVLVNKARVIYDALKTRIFYAEDYNSLTDEVVAIEKTLTNVDGAMLPAGFTIGTENFHLKFNGNTFGSEGPIILESHSTSGDFSDELFINYGTLNICGEGQIFANRYYDPYSAKEVGMFFFPSSKVIGLNSNFFQTVQGKTIFYNFNITDENGDDKWNLAFGIDYDTGEGFFNPEGITNFGSVRTTGYKTEDDSEGQTVDVEVITNIQMALGVLQKKTKTQTFKQGILTAVSSESDWVNA